MHHLRQGEGAEVGRYPAVAKVGGVFHQGPEAPVEQVVLLSSLAQTHCRVVFGVLEFEIHQFE